MALTATRAGAHAIVTAPEAATLLRDVLCVCSSDESFQSGGSAVLHLAPALVCQVALLAPDMKVLVNNTSTMCSCLADCMQQHRNQFTPLPPVVAAWPELQALLEPWECEPEGDGPTAGTAGTGTTAATGAVGSGPDSAAGSNEGGAGALRCPQADTAPAGRHLSSATAASLAPAAALTASTAGKVSQLACSPQPVSPCAATAPSEGSDAASTCRAHRQPPDQQQRQQQEEAGNSKAQTTMDTKLPPGRLTAAANTSCADVAEAACAAADARGDCRLTKGTPPAATTATPLPKQKPASSRAAAACPSNSSSTHKSLQAQQLSPLGKSKAMQAAPTVDELRQHGHDVKMFSYDKAQARSLARSKAVQQSVQQALCSHGGNKAAQGLLNTLQPRPVLQFTQLDSWDLLPPEARAYVVKKKMTCSVLLWGCVQGFGSGRNEQQAAESAAEDAVSYMYVCGAHFGGNVLVPFKERPPVQV